jgi:mannose-6-phosphate isomerase
VAARGDDPCLLVKLLDAGERLPVHIHPDDAFASEHLGSVHGKTEAWLVLEGGPVLLGFDRDVSAHELRRWVETQDTEAMTQAMHEIEVRPGDGILVPGGLPHAIGDGVFVVEVQQPTDFSILLEWSGYETDGRDVGHLGLGWERALSAVDRRGLTSGDVERLVVREGAGANALPRDAERYFRVARHAVDDTVVLPPGFRIVIGVDGDGAMTGDWGTERIRRGSTVLVPYGAGDLEVRGRVTFVECSPPAVGESAR